MCGLVLFFLVGCGCVPVLKVGPVKGWSVPPFNVVAKRVRPRRMVRFCCCFVLCVGYFVELTFLVESTVRFRHPHHAAPEIKFSIKLAIAHRNNAKPKHVTLGYHDTQERHEAYTDAYCNVLYHAVRSQVRTCSTYIGKWAALQSRTHASKEQSQQRFRSIANTRKS